MKNVYKTSFESEKSTLLALNKPLHDMLEKVVPYPGFPLYRASYGYGKRLLHDGLFQVVSDDGSETSIYSDSIDNALRNDLDYAISMPMGIVVNKCVELYIQGDDRTYPIYLFKKGDIFATTGVVQVESNLKNRRNFWQATSGARTSFLTTKLSDKRDIKKVSKYLGANISSQEKASEHYLIFSEISSAMESEWVTDVIFFPRQWFTDLPEDSLNLFKIFIYEYAWRTKSYWTESYLHDYEFSYIASKCKNISNNAFIYKVSRHLLGVCRGAQPSLIFCNDDESFPMTEILEIFLKYYDFHNNYPTPVTLDYLLRDGRQSVYYSFFYHLCDESMASKNKHSRRTNEIDEVVKTLRSISTFVSKNEQFVSNFSSLLMLRQCEFEMYHYANGEADDLLDPSNLLSDDKDLCIIAERAKVIGRSINTNSPYFSGLIKISAKSNTD